MTTSTLSFVPTATSLANPTAGSNKMARTKTVVAAALTVFFAIGNAAAQQSTFQHGLPTQTFQTTTHPTQTYPTGSTLVAPPLPGFQTPSTVATDNLFRPASTAASNRTLANSTLANRAQSNGAQSNWAQSNWAQSNTAQPNRLDAARFPQAASNPPSGSWPALGQTSFENKPALRTANAQLTSSRTTYRTNSRRQNGSPIDYQSASNQTASHQRTYNRAFDSLPSLPDTISNYRSDKIDSARRTAQQHRSESQSAPPVVADALMENAALANRWADLAERYTSLSRRVSDSQAKYDATSRDLQDVDAKLNQYGLTTTIGQLLQSKKEQLSEWQVKDSQSLFVSEELHRTRQEQLDLELHAEQNRTRLNQSNQEAARLLADAGYDAADVKNTSLVNRVGNLIDERHRWVADLQTGYRDYQSKLGELDSVSTKSAALANDYRKLINRHITWVRSDDPVSLSDFRDLKGGTTAFFNSNRSADFGPTLQRKVAANPIGAIGLLTTILVLFLIRWRGKAWLLGIGSRHRMRESAPSSRKAAASFLTVVVALAFPAILYAISRWLGSGIVSASTFNVAAAFAAAALVMLLVELCRQLIRDQGFIDKHVDVELTGVGRAASYLTLVGLGLAVAAYAVTLMGLVDHGIWKGSVARFGFMFSMLTVAWTAHLALRPSGGFAEPLIAKFGGSVFHRIRGIIYVIAIAFPIGMIVLSAVGYGFTANELTRRAMITLCAVLIGATLWSGIKILCANAWHILTGSAAPKRESDQYGPIDSPADSAGGQVTGVLASHSLELKHHLAFLCQCALVLGAVVCLGWLWIDIFPSVQMGNPVVWNVQDTVSQAYTDATGQTFVENVNTQTPVTAFHLLLAAVTLWIAFQLAKLLPAMFDALVLQRVSFDEGMEHLTLVLGRTLLFGAGCLIACKLLGVRWQLIQWLAVGLTIGLGFGLQDMVRNLFGGLIVLFEKPARLGDLITVGKVTGRVAAQKLRTTVLSDNEGREVIIPNKNFVSEDVVNWMGAGRLQAVAIEVAVTRDERPADICRSLQELALAQPNVLITPAPQATLICVAKGSQRIEIRVWIEEDQDAETFQNKLLNTTSQYLKQHDWWLKKQPTQPSLPDRHAALLQSSTNRQRRKRSA